MWWGILCTDLSDMDYPICYEQLYYVIYHERMLLLNALLTVKSSHEKKFMMKHFIIFFKIKLPNYVYILYYVLLWLFERKWSISSKSS